MWSAPEVTRWAHFRGVHGNGTPPSLRILAFFGAEKEDPFVPRERQGQVDVLHCSGEVEKSSRFGSSVPLVKMRYLSLSSLGQSIVG